MHFTTQRLQLRPICPTDREAVLDLLTNEIVGKTYIIKIVRI